MAAKLTAWSPDTCSCCIVFEWDDAVPAEQRVHTAVQRPEVRRCPFHPAGSLAEHYIAVLRENRRKNYAVGAAAGVLGIEPGVIEWEIAADSRRPVIWLPHGTGRLLLRRVIAAIAELLVDGLPIDAIVKVKDAD